MNIQEMHDTFNEKLDKSDNDWFTPEETDNWLNLATLQFVKDKHDFFEADEKVRTALHYLVRTLRLPNVSEINVKTFVNDYLYTLALEAEWEDSCQESGYRSRPIRAVQIDDIAKMKRDPFNKPIDDDPVYVQETNFGSSDPLLKVYSDTTPGFIVIRYLKMPATLSLSQNVSSDLHESVHEEIVDIAVRKAMVPIQDEMYPIQKQESIENKS